MKIRGSFKEAKIRPYAKLSSISYSPNYLGFSNYFQSHIFMHNLSCNSFPNNWKLNVWEPVSSRFTLLLRYIGSGVGIYVFLRESKHIGTRVYVRLYVCGVDFCILFKSVLIKKKKTEATHSSIFTSSYIWTRSFSFLSLDSFLIVFHCMYFYKPLRKNKELLTDEKYWPYSVK